MVNVTLSTPTVVAGYSKHQYEEIITPFAADDSALRDVRAILTTKNTAENGEMPEVVAIKSEDTENGIAAIYDIELPLGTLTAKPVVFAADKNATIQFYNVDMSALESNIFKEGDNTDYKGASLNTYDVTPSNNEKITQLVKVQVTSEDGTNISNYLIRMINYPSETKTAVPVMVDISLNSAVTMTDGKVYTSGTTNQPSLGRGPSVTAGTIGTVLAGDSGNEGEMLKDIIFASVATSSSSRADRQSTYAIKENGSVWSWGNNEFAQLGNGDTKPRNIPARVGTSYLSMDKYLYSLKVGGPNETLPAPSVDSFNVFDTGTGDATDAELLWQTYDGLNNVVEIVNASTGEIKPVGVGTTYIIVSIANDPLTTGLVKVEVRPSDLTVGEESVAYPQVAAGTDFSVALKADGTVWTWGSNDYGQLGNGVYNGSVVYPTKIDSLTGIKKIAAAGQFAVALKTDGTVWTWGRNDNGQLGNDTTDNSNVPVQVLKGEQNGNIDEKVYLEDIVAIAAGSISDNRGFVLALSSDGSVYGFGSNEWRQLNSENKEYHKTPVITPVAKAVDVAAGHGSTSYALTSNGSMYAWGKNNMYEYGSGSWSNTSTLTLVPLPNRVMSIGAGDQNGMAITYWLTASAAPKTATYAWGNNAYNSISAQNSAQISTPKDLLGRTDSILLGGGNAIYVIDKDGGLKTSGLGNYGQLSNGQQSGSNSTDFFFEAIRNDNTTVDDAIGAASSVGGTHTLFIDDKGSVWSVGNNTMSQLALQNAGDSISKAQKNW